MSYNPCIIATIAIICILSLIYSYYRVLKRLFCAFNAAVSGNQVQTGRLMPDDSNFDNPSFHNQSYALESTVINSLPTSQFKKENKEQRPRHTECAVCLGEFEEGEWLRHLPNCKHAFHITCIDTWFQSHSSCPLCRSCVCDPTVRPDCSVSMFTILESLRREDVSQDRAAHYQMLRSEVLRNPAIRYESIDGL